MTKLVRFAAACVAAVVAFGACGSLWGETCTYDGGWDVTPSGEADDIVIVSGDLTWGASLPAKVASWTQSGGTVTFQTVYGDTGFTLFEVTGDVSLTGGTWTHTENSSAETYRLAVTVGGNLNLGTDATIDVTGCGYVKGKGPGYPGGSAGGCYGGIGTNGSDANCYGSVMRPVNLGSGGNHNAGGGAIALTVGGTLTLNGAIVCDGYVGAKGRGDSVQYSGGSGGSVLLVANAFAGTGSVSASGGAVSTGYWGAGGRVALVQTGEATDFSAFTGSVHAWPTGKMIWARVRSTTRRRRTVTAGGAWSSTAALQRRVRRRRSFISTSRRWSLRRARSRFRTARRSRSSAGRAPSLRWAR